jgi:glucose/arabinose dehydrogenase
MKTWLRYLGYATLIALVLLIVGAKGLGVNLPAGAFRSAPKPVDLQLLRSRVRLPEGFSITAYARDLPDARILRVTEHGDLLVSLPDPGRVVLLERDTDGDGHPDARHDLLSGLNRPHGMDLHDGWLYVAETDAIGRIRFDAETRRIQGAYERIARLPGRGGHWSRTVRFGPDDQMYVTLGSNCNVCQEADRRRAAMLRFPPEGGEGELYASGLRNTVGFDWRPGTGQLYGVDNGRDWLGDDFPPCELNLIERGKFYGWPYANGNKVPDPDFGVGHADAIRDSVAPVHAFGAHTAPLSIIFLRASSWPAEYRNAALVALHGSWNRTRKQGYEVVSLHFQPDGSISEQKFATGFEVDEDVIGRPVDVAEGPDGAVYISDDYTGSIYRVAYSSAL